MGILRWGEWAKVVMEKLVAVQPGENLLILADTWTPMEAAEACLIAGTNAGANAHLLVIPRMQENDAREFRAAEGAILGADVIVALGGMENSCIQEASIKAREKGTRITSCNLKVAGDWALVGVLDVNYSLMASIAQQICRLWSKTKICRVVSSIGTDVSFELRGRPCDPGDGRAIRPGELDYFPGASPSIAPVEKTVNGTIVVDGSFAEPYRVVTEPITLRLEEGAITAVEGGTDANALRSRLQSTGEENAFCIAHFNIGINPAAKFGSGMEQDEMVMGVVTFGFGHQDPAFMSTVGPCSIHTDVTLRSAAVYLDGVLLCKDNTLNTGLINIREGGQNDK